MAAEVAAAETAARALLADGGWAAARLRPMLAELAVDPLAQPNLRVMRDGVRTGAVLHDDAMMTVTAALMSARALAARPAPLSVIVAGRLALTRFVRAGGARLERWEAGPVGEDASAAALPPARAVGAHWLHDGEVVRTDGRVEARFLAGATEDVLTLTATIKPGTAPSAREYRLADGALIRLAPTDDRVTRAEMLLAYLSAARRVEPDTAEPLTHHPSFGLRWQAMRAWLQAAGPPALPRLAAMAADDPHPEVRAAAAATLARVTARQSAEREAA